MGRAAKINVKVSSDGDVVKVGDLRDRCAR